MNRWRNLPILLVAAIMCGVGILKVWNSGGGVSGGYLLAGAGLVVIGVFIDREGK